MLNGFHRNRRGQAFVESLFVIPLIFMLFIFIVEMGFLMYNWSVLNFYTCSTAADDWTVNSRGYIYDVTGADPPATPADGTVYIYGTDRNTPVQRGSYINVNVNYPWHYRFFIIDSLSRFVVSEGRLRIKVNASVPSEVFIE